MVWKQVLESTLRVVAEPHHDVREIFLGIDVVRNAAGYEGHQADEVVTGLFVLEEQPIVESWLFAGSRGGAERFADVLSIVSTADAAGVDCAKYLPSIIAHIDTWPNRELDQLLPANWQTAFEDFLRENNIQNSTPAMH